MPKKGIEIRLSKSGPSGVPHAEILAPPNATLDQLISAQKTVFTDGLKALGCRACPACRSGLDIIIRQTFDSHIWVD